MEQPKKTGFFGLIAARLRGLILKKKEDIPKASEALHYAYPKQVHSGSFEPEDWVTDGFDGLPFTETCVKRVENNKSQIYDNFGYNRGLESTTKINNLTTQLDLNQNIMGSNLTKQNVPNLCDEESHFATQTWASSAQIVSKLSASPAASKPPAQINQPAPKVAHKPMAQTKSKPSVPVSLTHPPIKQAISQPNHQKSQKTVPIADKIDQEIADKMRNIFQSPSSPSSTSQLSKSAIALDQASIIQPSIQMEIKPILKDPSKPSKFAAPEINSISQATLLSSNNQASFSLASPNLSVSQISMNTLATSRDSSRCSSVSDLSQPSPREPKNPSSKAIRALCKFRIEMLINRKKKSLERTSIVKRSQLQVDSFLQVILSISTEELFFDDRKAGQQARELQIVHPLLLKYLPYYQAPKTVKVQFNSMTDYVTTFTPLFIYNSWANVISNHKEMEPSVKKRLFNFKLFSQSAEVVGSLYRFEIRSMVYRWQLQQQTNLDKYLFENFLVVIDCNGIKRFGYVEEYHINDGSWDAFPTTLLDYPVLEGNRKIKQNIKAFEVYMIRCAVIVLPEHYQEFRLVQGNAMRIQPIECFASNLRIIETLQSMYTRHFFENILVPKREICQMETIQGSEQFTLLNHETYNFKQMATIISCLKAVLQQSEHAERILMIQGPPGTGKSHTLIGIVDHLFANWTKSHKKLKIMICAPSNAAIDEIGHRLIKLNNEHQRYRKLLRVGRLEKVSNEMLSYHIVPQLRLLGGDSERHGRERKKLILSTDIILSTLTSSQKYYFDEIYNPNNQSILPADEIHVVIVDEAAQCSEPELLMPMVYPINKMILIGDHKQLPATVKSKVAEKSKYGISMFERFRNYFEGTKNNDKTLITLTEQYRMHIDIVRFPSNRFYHNKLSTPIASTGVNPLIPLKPYLVFDVKGTTESTWKPTTSFYNENEINFVMTLIVTIISKLGYPLSFLTNKSSQLPVTIGVITFYKGQKLAMLEHLKTFQFGAYAKHVKVNTVDGYQGQECDIVILSCVRSNLISQIGFVRLHQRMNVALTRAKSACYVCHSRDTFQTNMEWKTVSSFAASRGTLHSIAWNAGIENIASLISK